MRRASATACRQIVWAILKRWGFGCDSKAGGQSSPMAEQTGAESTRAVSRRNKAGDEPTSEPSEAHKWSGLKRLLKRHSRPTELLKLIKHATIILIVSVLVADVFADIPVQIMTMEAKGNSWWVFPLTVYALLPVLVSIFIAEDVGLKAVLSRRGLRRAMARPEFNIAFEAFSFVLTVLAVVFYLIGTYSTSGFRKGDYELGDG